MQALVQKSFAVIPNMADDLYKNRTEKKTIKDSIRKCASAAVFLGKISQDILNLRREKIAPELNQNYKKLTFKTENHPKHLFRDDLPKTIKDISETNQIGQSLTQRYQPTLKQETFTKTGKSFLFKSQGYHQRGRPRQNVQPYPSYQQRQLIYRFNKNTVIPNH